MRVRRIITRTLIKVMAIAAIYFKIGPKNRDTIKANKTQIQEIAMITESM